MLHLDICFLDTKQFYFALETREFIQKIQKKEIDLKGKKSREKDQKWWKKRDITQKKQTIEVENAPRKIIKEN